MTRSRPWASGAVALLLFSLSASPAFAQTIAPSDLESQFIALLAEERSDHGVAPLVPMDELVVGARAQALEMSDAGHLFHNPDLGAVLANGWNKLGENVGFGYSAPTLHTAFMNSPGHRDNIVEPTYDHVGVGTVQVGGSVYVAVVFADMIDRAVPSSDDGETSAVLDAAFSGTFSDDDTSEFQPAIEAISAAGITSGCGGNRFCPDDPVTRGQMAVFLTRVLGLSAPAQDSFVDDDQSVFEPAIEAIAAIGITLGCGGNRFCPDDPVTRGQMAVFVGRARHLAPGVGDSFEDDNGSPYESAIEALAGLGIVKGCADNSYCPDANVSRGQMAVFLTRAFDL